MKKVSVLTAALMVALFSFARPADVSEKVKKIFRETYAKAQDVQWVECKPNYEVSFSLSGIQSKIIYDTDGNIVSSLRYYSPDNLPVHILSKLKRKYSDKELFGITEVSSEEGITYFIKMHDAQYWYTVKADSEGNLELSEKMKRGDIGLL
jgi:hypothetical protein